VARDQQGGSHEETDFGSVAHFHSRDGRGMGTALLATNLPKVAAWQIRIEQITCTRLVSLSRSNARS